MFSLMCFCKKRERKQRERDGEHPRAASSARMSPHRVIPRRVARLRSPLAFHPVWLFRSNARAEHLCGFVPEPNHCKVSWCRLQRQVVLPGFLADEALLGGLGDGQLGGALGAFRALHDFLAQLVVTQRAAVLG